MSLADLQKKYGAHADSAPFQRYSDARTAIKDAGVDDHAGDDHAAMDSMAGPEFGPGSPHGPSHMGMRDETGRPVAGDSRPPFGGGRPPGFGPRSADEQFESRIRMFRERHGPDKAVVIRVIATDHTACMDAIRQMCSEDLKQRSSSISFMGDQGLALLTYHGPLSDVMDHIDWGTVTSSDESTRTIHVRQN